MISIAKATAQYFKNEFAKNQERYLSKVADREINRTVGGSLAKEFGLRGKITKEEFDDLVNGRDPRDERVLVGPTTKIDKETGEKKLVKRPGWDLTLSPPKSVSLAALVGEDERVVKAHRDAVKITMAEAEKFVQAKMGNINLPEITANFLYVQFEHDSNRPVDGAIAPQLHTHNFVMNMTRDAKGQIRALETANLYDVQHYLTTVYRNALAANLRQLGYDLHRRRDGKFEIAGFSPETLKAFSPRSEQRDRALERRGLGYSAKAAEVAILGSREKKIEMPEVELRAGWKRTDEKNEAARVVAAARSRAPIHDRGYFPQEMAGVAFNSAVARLTERYSVLDETRLLAEMMAFEIGGMALADAKREVAARIQAGELIEGAGRRVSRQAVFTTPELIRWETEILAAVSDGKQQFRSLATDPDRSIKNSHELNAGQKAAIREILANEDRIFALDGKAGTGKSTTLKVVAEAARESGYDVRFFAPTTKAVGVLQRDGLTAKTLQSLLFHSPTHNSPSLYVVDEASMVSTRMMKQLIETLGPNDRLLLVGDPRQHLAVEAGNPFEQMLKAGMGRARLDEIMRQKNADLRNVVTNLSRGNVTGALDKLTTMGTIDAAGNRREAIVEIADRMERLDRMAADYIHDPDSTLVVAPDNHTRREINERIRIGLRAAGKIGAAERAVNILVPIDLYNEDKKRARSYEVGNVVKYLRDAGGFQANELATVVAREKSTITVERKTGERVTYNPHGVSSVTVHYEEERTLSVGDRIQFTAADRDRNVANRDLGTVVEMTDDTISIKIDSGATVCFSSREVRHIDHGYAVTSHSSQSETVNRVLVHAQSDQARMLVNERMAYVAVSRARNEARMYTDDFGDLREAMARSYGKEAALDVRGKGRCLSREAFPQKIEPPAQKIDLPKPDRLRANPRVSTGLVRHLEAAGNLYFVEGQPRMRVGETDSVAVESRFDPRRPAMREGACVLRFGAAPISRFVVADSPERLLEKITSDHADRRAAETLYVAVSADHRLPATLLRDITAEHAISGYQVIEADKAHPNSLSNEIARQREALRHSAASREVEREHRNPERIDPVLIERLKSQGKLRIVEDGAVLSFSKRFTGDHSHFSPLVSRYDPTHPPATEGVCVLRGSGKIDRVVVCDSPEAMLRRITDDKIRNQSANTVYAAVSGTDRLPREFARDVKAAYGAVKIEVVETNPDHPRSLTHEVEGQRLEQQRRIDPPKWGLGIGR